MEVQVILGRPESGKTQRIIDELNSVSGKSVLFSFENPEDLMIERGLNKNVKIIDSLELTQEEMAAYCSQNDVEVIGIDTIEVMPADIDLQALLDNLKETPLKRVLMTSHLRRDFQINDILKKRIASLRPEYIRL